MSDLIDRLVPIPETAHALGVAQRTVRWWIQIGKIGSAKPGSEPGNKAGRVCVPLSEINRIIRESRVPARREFIKAAQGGEVVSEATTPAHA